MDAEELLQKRMKELAQKAYQQSIYTNTPFLSLAEQSLYYDVESQVSYAHGKLTGGYEDAERRMVVFGSESLFGYESPDPIVCLRIEPTALKFSEPLSHRDYLGSVLGLGIERECIGDILVEETGAYLFCLEHIAPFLEENFTKVKHTLVKVEQVEKDQIKVQRNLKPIEGFLSSFRLDATISLAFSLSRKESAAFIKGKRVFLNGRMIENGSKVVTEGDVISVRGKGKVRFSEVRGQSKKGRFSVLMHLYC